MAKTKLYILTNMNGNLNDDIQLMWIFLMDLEKQLELLNVIQNCIRGQAGTSSVERLQCIM